MIGPVVTLGFGPGASIGLVTLLGFSSSTTPFVPPPPTPFADVFAPRQNLTGGSGLTAITDKYAPQQNLTGKSGG